jgi:hypothetical protein
MLLKSSDFITHDLSVNSVFNGTTDVTAQTSPPSYELELVLRKWYPVDSSREFRCFVRENRLLGRYDTHFLLPILNPIAVAGITQRDANYYDFLNDPETREKITTAVTEYWKSKIVPRWKANEDCT